MKQNILIITITFLSTVFMLFISGIATTYQIKDIILVITVFISILAIILGFYSFYRSEKNLIIISDNIEILNKLKIYYENMILPSNLSWLYTERQLLNIEKKKKHSKEVWIVSPDPSDDTGNSPWIKVIQNNIQDGITYYYFVPDTKYLDGAIKGLKTVFRNYLSNCYIYKLDPNDYANLLHSHIVLYDPHNEHNETESYSEIDIDEKGWWIKMSVAKNNIIIGQLSSFVAKAKNLNTY